jgi:DNA-binding CsgD family transcriptional regulator
MIRPPPGLEIEIIEVDGAQLLRVSWPTGRPRSDLVLTAAENDVLARILRGASNAEIARDRGTSERTVANQVHALLRKCRVGSRHQLIAKLSHPVKYD